MIPEMALINEEAGLTHIVAWEPDNRLALCVHEGNANPSGNCQSGKVLGQGTTTAIGTGAGSIVGGNNTLTRFASTFQSLVNDTTLVSEVYYDTLQGRDLQRNHRHPGDVQHSHTHRRAFPPPSSPATTS